MAAFKAGKHEHNLHHSCMADCEGSDTDKGKCIGKIAQQDFEHFEQTLYNEHSFFLWHNLRFLFHQSCKGLLEEDQDQWYAKHDKEQDSSRKCMSCEDQCDGNGSRAVEDQPCHRVGIEPDMLCIVCFPCIDDIKDHTQKDKSHAKANGNNKYRIQFTDKGYGHHIIHWAQPQCRKQVFKAEEASKQDSEDSGKYTCTADDACQCNVFEFVKKETADKQQQSLSCISEHGAEDK